jgi:medium-chain acyl-[acyl-carrier-protein] hydrolase
VSTSFRNPWFRRYPARQPPEARLIGFHHAGGSASFFRTWSAALPAGLEIVGVQLPGREERLGEPPLRSVAQVVDELARHIGPLLDLPCSFFGHSMGAMLAFELTRALRRAGRATPQRLFVSGRWAPQLPDPSGPLSDLPRDEFIDEVRRLGGTPAEVLAHGELLELLLPTLRADFALCESYRYDNEAPLDTAVIAFAGLDDPGVTVASVQQWSVQTTAEFRARFLPGGHFFVNSARPELLAELSATLQVEVGAHRRAGPR